ncbi:hypothetical protein LTR56_002981 [Elasticomyces elasticus]|nr:hypothetical protein LTR22_014704 [Elasticomyces elasticus]KAK3656633.1 hypothetical protein LTR56_002981 [Elasticomyces elasticus]KAK4930765.1 hypothetical protein LTR49_002853 [Elasticomyces elasticus]KAK5755606.1 hypothetical protein LTS12_014265 [Elasticomyces elasticus]
MGSKKQRSKQAKGSDPKPANKDSSSSSTVHSTASTPTQPMPCYCDACLKPYTPATKDSDSPFLRMPREIREKIYKELLISRMSPEKQAQYDKLLNMVPTSHEDLWTRQNAIDMYEQQNNIMPDGGGRGRYQCMVESIGLLLANKQIHAESNSVFFSENTFEIMPEWERVRTFWRCPRMCVPAGQPCLMLFHNFAQIKNLSIAIQIAHQYGDPRSQNESAYLLANIKNVVDSFKQARITLKTLKLRFVSSFAGQLDALRHAIECTLPPGFSPPANEAMIKLSENNFLLEPFLSLTNFAEDVDVGGDIPQKLIDRLTRALSTPTVSLAIKKKKARDEATKALHRASVKPGLSSQTYWKDIRDTAILGGTSTSLPDMMMRTSIKSPAVMEMLMAPPSQESLDRWNAERPQRQAAAAAQEGAVTEILSLPAVRYTIGLVALAAMCWTIDSLLLVLMTAFLVGGASLYALKASMMG